MTVNISASLRESVGGGIRVFDTEIPHSVRIPESSIEGKSIFAYDRNCKAAMAYEAFSKYELVAGHRRKKACELAGIKTLKAEIRNI